MNHNDLFDISMTDEEGTVINEKTRPYSEGVEEKEEEEIRILFSITGLHLTFVSFLKACESLWLILWSCLIIYYDMKFAPDVCRCCLLSSSLTLFGVLLRKVPGFEYVGFISLFNWVVVSLFGYFSSFYVLGQLDLVLKLVDKLMLGEEVRDLCDKNLIHFEIISITILIPHMIICTRGLFCNSIPALVLVETGVGSYKIVCDERKDNINTNLGDFDDEEKMIGG